MKTTLWQWLYLGLSAVLAGAAEPTPRVVFLGDSITQDGRYVSRVDAAMISQRPSEVWEILSVGLASETVSGLSEDGHAGGAFPRPDVAERLDRVLTQMKPTLVFACYGMNCGIYKPLDAERFAAYQRGMTSLREKVLATGAKFVVMTPPVFDVHAQTKPGAAAPAFDYDDVLAAYSAWLVGKRAEGWTVLDLHTPMNAQLLEKRKAQPEFTFSKDGVHPDDEGHQIMAGVICEHLGLKNESPPAVLEKVTEKQTLLKLAWLSATGHKRPGIQAGLPLAEAQAKAAVLDREAREAAKAPQ